jgi:iron complex transport system ATP-binding protein
MFAPKNIAIHADSISVNLGFGLGKTPVLHGVSFELPQGRWTSVVGPNGAGKTTLLQCLAGLLPHTGVVSIAGRRLAELPARERARQLSWLGQSETVADDLTVGDLAMLGRMPHQAWLAPPSAQDHAAVERALRSTQAWEWRHRPLGQLSGGERQRVLLARALAVEAPVLLMDEPLVNLDPPHQADWLELVRAMVQQGRTVVSVLHEIHMALQADDMLILAQGRVVHHGACGDSATHTALESVFQNRIAVRAVEGQWLALHTPPQASS